LFCFVFIQFCEFQLYLIFTDFEEIFEISVFWFLMFPEIFIFFFNKLKIHQILPSSANPEKKILKMQKEKVKKINRKINRPRNASKKFIKKS